MKKFCFEAVLALLLCVGGGSITSFAQHRVQGSVTDTDGEPLIGVSVMIEGTVTGVATDLDGHYVIDVPVRTLFSNSITSEHRPRVWP